MSRIIQLSAFLTFVTGMLLWLVVTGGLSCGGGDNESCPPGAERCACAANGSCDEGLVCLSKHCVDPSTAKDSGAISGDDASAGDSGRLTDGGSGGSRTNGGAGGAGASGGFGGSAGGGTEARGGTGGGSVQPGGTAGNDEIGGSGGNKGSCADNGCNGHGTCILGICVCDTGYSGTSCNQCAGEYSGYPICTLCTCSTGQQQCDGSTAINYCTDGCQWTSYSCTTVCEQKSVSRSSGCAWDPSLSLDMCWCPSALTNDIMVWKFRDTCNDNKSVSVGIYDQTSSESWGPFNTLNYDQDLSVVIDCKTGDSICLGAWNDTQQWGCGQQCSQTCTPSCCYTCGSTLVLSTQLLGC
jgi:hypothetical protein